jgi:hypothetical protein
MDFLPCLIPGTLSSRINATLAVVCNESKNGYNYLWRVLELTVSGFDPVIPIQTLQWLDCKNIFQFSQAYLLYFCLQAKMHYHFTYCTRSSIFLHAIQNSDRHDPPVTRELVPGGLQHGIPTPNLQLHGLAESIHLNAQARLWDVITP